MSSTAYYPHGSKSIGASLSAYKAGELEEHEAAQKIKNLHYEDIGYAKVDHSRSTRQGFPEVVFGSGKTRAQIVGIVERLARRSPNVIVTHTDEGTFGEVRNVVTEAEWHESARLIRIQRDFTELGVGVIATVTAGTSDIPVAEEAALTAEAMGNRVERPGTLALRAFIAFWPNARCCSALVW